MRLTKAQLRARIKGRLPITFSDERISSHGGLELVRLYLEGLGLRQRLEQALEIRSDYGASRIVLALIGIAAGGRCAHHASGVSRGRSRAAALLRPQETAE